MPASQSFYQVADQEIRENIGAYLSLAAKSNGLATIDPGHLTDPRTRSLVVAGYDLPVEEQSADAIHEEWQRRQAIPFELERAVAMPAYPALRTTAEGFFEAIREATDGFSRLDEEYLADNPQHLSVVQHVMGIRSKSQLRSRFGASSDRRVSKPAATRIAEFFNENLDTHTVDKDTILERLEQTFEGIVRDLIGRVLLESIVDAALRRENLTYLREQQYQALKGVVYDFRADFVLPDQTRPKVFIEVRKSSSRHASLYSKDKMFSAINWKGRDKELLAVLIVDGEWTSETLRVMANVFDYVVPIGRVNDVVRNVKSYLDGDARKLKWVINLTIDRAQSI